MIKKKIEQLLREDKNIKVVSFDIFDTLIFRKLSNPEDVFKLIGKKISINEFDKIRQEQQMLASQMLNKTKGYPHANFDEIYSFVNKNKDIIDICEDIKSLELEIEKDILYTNQEMYDIYELAIQLGKRVIATSDMYFSKNIIEEILKNCSYSKFDQIYVSSEFRKTKYEGDLFDKVIELENVSPNEILHIGDNYESDFKNASKKDIKAVHYDRYVTNKYIDESIFNSINSGISKMMCINNDNFWYKLGVKVGGPLYIGLIKWIENFLTENKYEKIYCLSRDGYILKELLEMLDIIETEYLCTSRRALLLAGITELDTESLNSLPPYTYGQTILEVFEYLDMKDIDYSKLGEFGFESPNDTIKNSNDIANIKRFFKANENIILKKCNEERKEAELYFETKGFFKEKALIFDCGWNGSSQYLTDKFLNAINYNDKPDFIYTGILNSSKSNKQLNLKNYKSYIFDIGFNEHIAERVKNSIVLLELFFGAPHNSVLKYSNGKPILEMLEEEQDYKIGIIEGIIDYVKQIYPLVKKYNIDISIQESIEEILRLIEDPKEDEAFNIGNIRNIDGFVAQKGVDKYIANIKLKDLIRNPKIEVYWPQGILKRDDVGFLVKFIIANRFGIKSRSNKNSRRMIVDRNTKLYKSYRIIKDDGWSVFMHRLKQKINNKSELSDYEKWIITNEGQNEPIDSMEYNPKISIVVPVYNVKSYQLKECIEFVLNQTYNNWELCIVDDFSTLEEVRQTLKLYENIDKVKVVYRKENGHISIATNDAIKIATGEFIGFLDCDDVLARNALYEVVKLLNEKPDLDFIYSDEDKLTEDSKKRHSPFFKPDWSPDTFMSLMYTCHFGVYRKTIVDRIGGLRIGFEGAQDYDFTLRFTEQTDKIGHISKILYHWRERQESLAINPESKPYALEAVKKSKEEALIRRGLEGIVEYVPRMYQYRVRYINKNNPLISIVIPSKDNHEILSKCIHSIKENTLYPNYEIIVVDNGSIAENKEIYSEICLNNKCKYHYEEMEFNFSKMCNIGANISKGEYILFLNDDIEVIQDNWLDILVGHSSLEKCGAVGAKLLYPNSNIIQHIGITNLRIGPSHSLIGYNDLDIYYYGRNILDYNYIAVTGACLMVAREKFYEIGMFDEKLAVAYNDIDLCFSLIEKGYYNVVRNDVVLYHHESFSRGIDNESEEKRNRLAKERTILFNKHKDLEQIDPFYNVNLTYDKINYSININNDKISKVKLIDKNYKFKYEGVKAHIDMVKDTNDIITIEGWAFIESLKYNNINNIEIILKNSKGRTYLITTDKCLRLDVNDAFNEYGNLNLTGFKASILKQDIEYGEYIIGIYIKNKLFNKMIGIFTDKKVSI